MRRLAALVVISGLACGGGPAESAFVCPSGTTEEVKATSRSCVEPRGGVEVRHGPWLSEDGDVVERGQYEHGREVGVWTREDRSTGQRGVTTRAPDGAREEVWTTADGVKICRITHDPEGRPTGEWTWWRSDGAVEATYRYVDGQLQGYEDASKAPLKGSFGARIEVLDVDPVAGRVAYRVIDPYGGEEEPFDCQYGGMKDPGESVRLGVYTIGEDKPEEWVIYEHSMTAGGCTPEAESKARLAAARARFAALGLDPDRRPAPDARPAVTLKVTTNQDAYVEDMTDHRPFVLGDSDYSGYVLGEWTGITRAPLWLYYDKAMAGGGRLEPLGSWSRDGAVIAGWHATWQPRAELWGFVQGR